MTELIENFGLDWHLLIAQAVNFLILLWVLKKFAYAPILEVLRKRKREIEKGLEYTRDAEEKLARVGKEREEILRNANKEALSVVSQAEKTAQEKGDNIINNANKKIETAVMSAKKAIAEEKSKMGEEIAKNAEELIRLGISKVLGNLPSEKRDGQLVKEALKELKTIK